MKFLKRQKRNEDDLDLPPAPPLLGGFDEELPDLDFPEEEKLGLDEELPDLPDIPDDIPDIEEEHLPDIPPVTAHTEIPGLPFEIHPPIKEPTFPVPEPPKEPEYAAKEETEHLDEHQRIGKGLFLYEKRLFSPRPSAQTVYVKVDNFKAILGSINRVRSDLKKSEDSLIKLERIKSSKDRSLDKVKSSLDDLQRKLVYIDKTLFKGE